MRILQTYLSAFFDLAAPPPVKEEFQNGEPPIRSWKSMIVPLIILIFIIGVVVFS